MRRVSVSFPLSWGILIFYMVAPSLARAQTSSERLADARKALQAQADEFERDHPKKENTHFYKRYHKGLHEALEGLQYAQQRLEAGERDNALEGLRQVRANEAVRADIKAMLGNVMDDLKNQAPAQTPPGATATAAAGPGQTAAGKAQQLEAETNALLKGAAAKVLAATDSKELEPLVQELNEYLKLHAKDNPPGRETEAFKRVHSAALELPLWQDYLAAKARGSGWEVESTMRRLADNDRIAGLTPFLPRSEILARIPRTFPPPAAAPSPGSNVRQKTEEAATEILNSVHTLDDLSAAVAKLDKLRVDLANDQVFPTSNSALPGIQSALQELQINYAALRSGSATMISLRLAHAGAPSERPAIDAKINALRLDLTTLALPRLLGEPGEKPAPNEAFDGLLQRLLAAAKKREDWDAVIRGLDIAAALSPVLDASTNSYDQQLGAFQQFLAAKNLEAAGQYEQAAIGFLKTLKTGLPGLPVTLLGQHLKAIQMEHSTEFAAANARVLAPTPAPPIDPLGFARLAEAQGLVIDPKTGVAYRPSRHGDASLVVTMTMSLPAVTSGEDTKAPTPGASP